MRTADTLRLGRLFGIRIGVSRTWFLVLFLVIYVLNGYFRSILADGTQAFVVAVIAALLFFATVVAHELGHALVARHQGMTVDGIDLWALGGFTRTRGEPLTPGSELRLAAAGPAVNAVVIAICIGAGLAFGSFRHFLDVALLQSDVHAGAALVLLSWLALINAVLLVFNLLPALPLDGGRIARAIVWGLTGDANRATRACARFGQLLGTAMIGGGVWMVVRTQTGYGLWFVLIGLFLYQAARQALLTATIGARIRAVTVGEIMDREPVTVPSQASLLEVREELLPALVAAFRGSRSPTTTGATAGCSRHASSTSCARAGPHSAPPRSLTTRPRGASTRRPRSRPRCAPTACAGSARSSPWTATGSCAES